MRISNDNIINSTNERLIQVKNNTLLKNSSTDNNPAANKVNAIAASIRETNFSMQAIQSNLTRNQIALEALSDAAAELNSFGNQEINSVQAEQIKKIVNKAVENTLFSGERILNISAENVNDSSGYKKLMKRIAEEQANAQANIDNGRTEISRLSIKNENQLAAMSMNSVINVRDGVNHVVQNMNQLFSAQANIQNEQVRELLNL